MSEVVYRDPQLGIGAFRRAPCAHDFTDSGPTRGHLIVFPREPVMITHAGRAPILADPNVAMIYNRGQEYTRRALSPAGDRCEWFAFDAASVLAASALHPVRATDEDRPFAALTHAPTDAATYALARRVFDHVRSEPVDALFVTEASATLLDRVIARACGSTRPAAVTRAHAELAEGARSFLARRFTTADSLDVIAQSLGVSMFHLAHVFRRVTGSTLHAYRTQLRLRAALERIAGGTDLATLALELGFSSHSHFTQTFRNSFGAPPSRLRTRS